MSTAAKPSSGLSRVKKIAISISALLCVVAIMLFVAFRVSPWSHVLLVRRAFTRDVLKGSPALEKHIPAGAASVFHHPDAFLDHYFPIAFSPTGTFSPINAELPGSMIPKDNYFPNPENKGYMPLVLSWPEMSTALLEQPWKPKR